MRLWAVCGGPFEARSRAFQTQLCGGPYGWERAISLGSRSRLCAAQLKTNSQFTLCSPRSLNWRIGPVCFSQPDPFSTSHLRLRRIA